MTPDEMIALSAREAVGAMRNGDFTALEYCEALLARCAEGAELNAFITIDPEAVRVQARNADARRTAGENLGPLHGLPVPIKDSINTADLPTTAGTEALRNFRPVSDAAVVTRLRDAGAIILGKTNLHELSLGWTSSNMAYGPVRNPWDRTRIPGGSSGGTAAAVAFGMAPLGLAEDTQGSIRVPAALCGIAGFRPTTGRYPNQGCAPISELFDQVGPLARNVDDLALFDSVMTGDYSELVVPQLERIRLGIAPEFYFAGLDPAVASVVESALERLVEAGVTIVRADMSGLDTLVDAITLPVQIHDVVPSLRAWLSASDAALEFDEMLVEVSPDVKALLAVFALPGAPHEIPDDYYVTARDVQLPTLQALIASWFAEHEIDAMFLPATMVTATPIGATKPFLSTVSKSRSQPRSDAISRRVALPGCRDSCCLPG